MRKNERGFTLVEVLVVMTIIVAVALMAIPRMLEARYGALEANAATYLRSVHQSQVQYMTREGTWATFADLRTKGYMKQDLSGYDVALSIAPDGGGYEAIATPIPRPAEMRHFFVDTSGVVREQTGLPADVNSRPSGG